MDPLTRRRFFSTLFSASLLPFIYLAGYTYGVEGLYRNAIRNRPDRHPVVQRCREMADRLAGFREYSCTGNGADEPPQAGAPPDVHDLHPVIYIGPLRFGVERYPVGDGLGLPLLKQVVALYQASERSFERLGDIEGKVADHCDKERERQYEWDAPKGLKPIAIYPEARQALLAAADRYEVAIDNYRLARWPWFVVLLAWGAGLVVSLRSMLTDGAHNIRSSRRQKRFDADKARASLLGLTHRGRRPLIAAERARDGDATQSPVASTGPSIDRGEAIDQIVEHELPLLTREQRREVLEAVWPTSEQDPDYQNLDRALLRDMVASRSASNPADPRYDAVLRIALRDVLQGTLNDHLQQRLAAIGRNVRVTGAPESMGACPCCDYKTIATRCTFERCRVCGWIDAWVLRPDKPGIANPESLDQARANFIAHGAARQSEQPFVVTSPAARFARAR